MYRKMKWSLIIVTFMVSLLCVSINCYAYSDKNSDYILTTERPEDKTKGHYLEFVSEETYTVQNGDTLWGIANSHWGSSENYQKIASDNSDVIKAPDLSVLSNCPRLAYLTLYTGNLENFDFLGNLPEIYYLRLSAREACKRKAPDVSLLPNACFIEIYGYKVRSNIGEGYLYR